MASGNEFSRLELARQHQPLLEQQRSKNFYWWQGFKARGTEKLNGQIRTVHIAPDPHPRVAMAAAEQAVVFDSLRAGHKTLNRVEAPSKGVLSCRWRQDGRMYAIGLGIGNVMIKAIGLDYTAELKGFHTEQVNDCWFTGSKGSLLSVSNDKQAALWDLQTQQHIQTLQGHTDYVRTAHTHPTNNHIVVTGGFDRTVRMWDTRISGSAASDKGEGGSPGSVFSFPHEEPVECVRIHPSGGSVASASGRVVALWDLRQARQSLKQLGEGKGGDQDKAAGVEALHTSAHHNKTVTSLCFDRHGYQLITGGLDSYIKCYSTRDYECAYTLTAKTGVMALDYSADGSDLAVGLQDGNAVFYYVSGKKRRRKQAKGFRPGASGEAEEGEEGEESLTVETGGEGPATGTLGALASGEAQYAASMGLRKIHVAKAATPKKIMVWQPAHCKADAGDMTVEGERRVRLMKWDKLLRAFKYKEALDAVLNSDHEAKRSREVQLKLKTLLLLSMLEELQRRNGLRIALSGRKSHSLEQLVGYLGHILSMQDGRHINLVLSVLDVVLEVYAPVVSQSQQLTQNLARLKQDLDTRLALLQDLFTVKGAVATIMAQGRVAAARREGGGGMDLDPKAE